MVEYIIAIDVTRARFPADAFFDFRAHKCACIEDELDFSSTEKAQLGGRQTEDQTEKKRWEQTSSLMNAQIRTPGIEPGTI